MAPIKNLGAAAPKASKIKIIKPGDAVEGDRLSKEAMADRTWLVTLHEYDSAHPGQYGETPRAIVDLREVGGDGSATRHWLWSTAAKQAGESLDPGEIAVGLFKQMTSKGGREYYGWQWVDDPAVIARAEKLLEADAEKLPF